MSLAAASFNVPATGDYAYDWALVDVETSGLIARRDRVLSVCDPGPVEVTGPHLLVRSL